MTQPLIGPAMPADAAQRNLCPGTSYVLAIGSADSLMSAIFAAGFCRNVVALASGTVYVKRQGDSVFTPYAVSAGTAIAGIIVAVGGTVTGSSAITVNCEL